MTRNSYKPGRQHMMDLIELSQDGFAVVDKDGTIQFWNEGAELIFGHTQEDALGKNISLLGGTVQEGDHRERLARGLFQHKGQMPKEYRIVKDGSRKEIESTATVIKTASGEPLMLVAFRDVTETRSLIKQLEVARSQLQRLAQRRLEAQEQERQQIAAELHDGVGQSLAALKLTLLSIQNTVPEADGHKLERAIAIVSDSISQLRSISLDLRPPILDELGFISTMYWLAEEFKLANDMPVKLLIKSFPRKMSKDIDLCLFRVVQEALSNAAKHSQATSVRLLVKRAGRFVIIRVQDNGIGFDANRVLQGQAGKSGIGLASIRERVERLGGGLSIRSDSKNGTIVWARLPFRQPGKADEPEGEDE